MDRLFDWLGELLRRAAGAGGAGGAGARSMARAATADPFLREAEQELEEYLRGGWTGAKPTGTGRPGPGRPGPAPVPESLRRDFANLELESIASFEQVRRSYRRLLSRYHPDRFAGDPEKQRLATRIVQILGSSFRRIRDFRSETD